MHKPGGHSEEENMSGGKNGGKEEDIKSSRSTEASGSEGSESDAGNVEDSFPDDKRGNEANDLTLSRKGASDILPPYEQHTSTAGSRSLDGHDETVDHSEKSDGEESLPRGETVDELAHIIEAIIFASDEPLSVGTIKSVLDSAHTFGRINPDMVIARINTLNNRYDSDGSGFHIIEIAEGYQFATRKELAQWVSYLFKEKAKRKLSNSALETLAIIAYKQPITKPGIESIRGVNVDYVLHNLLEKELVTVVGRAETVGRPLLYGSTQKFLKIFGLKNLDDLPKLREIEEIIKEIRSRGAEESIQLEITAFGDQLTSDTSNSESTFPNQEIKTDDHSDGASQKR